MDVNKDIVIMSEGYDRIDGRNAYHSNIKRLTLGMPIMEKNKNMQIAMQIWEEKEDGTLSIAMELPIHQIMDSMIFLSRTMLYFREAYRYPLLYNSDNPVIERIGVQGGVSICEEVKRNWMCGEMKIANILLEGDAGSGKTQLAKALSADFGLPYTKVTCFADVDKSDILGSILPVLPDEKIDSAGVEYKYYPSEIIRAYENGWLLEIQEPTVIRETAVLMALNSALEPDGSINLPTRIVHRHPDFIAVITINRGYNGCFKFGGIFIAYK